MALSVIEGKKYAIKDGIKQMGFFGIHGVGICYPRACDMLELENFYNESPLNPDNSVADAYSTHGVVIISNVDASRIDWGGSDELLLFVVDIISENEIMIKLDVISEDFTLTEPFIVTKGGKLPEDTKKQLGISGNIKPPHGNWYKFVTLKDSKTLRTAMGKLYKNLKSTYPDVIIHYVVNIFPLMTVIYELD